MLPSWLPDLVLLGDFNGDWKRYFEEVYERFRVDFVGQNFLFRGKRVFSKCIPRTDGKEATFWHSFSEGRVERQIARYAQMRTHRMAARNDGQL